MRSGRILASILILAGAAGALLNGAAVYARLLYLGLLLGAGAFLWTFLVSRSLTLERSARIMRANVGDVFEEWYEVRNRGRLIAPWIEVENQSTLPAAAGSRLLTLVPGRQFRTFLARTWLTRRGAFHLGPTRLITGDPFGLFTRVREFPSNQTLVVMPMLFNINTFVFPPGLLPGGQVIRRKSSDITPHAAGVREYAHGDALKRIHWPTSVRRGQLMVKEFEQDPQAEIWLFLDLQKEVHSERPHRVDPIAVESILFGKRPKFNLPPSTLEYAVSISASLAHYFLTQRKAVGFVSAGQNFIVHAAEKSERQEGRILETLAFVEADGDLSIAALVAAQASQIPQGASAIIVTSSTRPDLLAAVDDLQRRYLRPVIILLDAYSFNGRPGSDKLHHSLRERRVPVCVVACDADLSTALSEFSVNLAPQEARSWQTPISLQ